MSKEIMEALKLLHRPTLKVMLDDGAYLPLRAHEFDAGADLMSRETVTISAHGMHFFDTGVHIETPAGFVTKVENRSSMFKRGIVTTGVVDCGYTGSIGVTAWNMSDEDYVVRDGDKIAQLVVYPISLPEFEIVDELEETERGNNGFGSTGC